MILRVAATERALTNKQTTTHERRAGRLHHLRDWAAVCDQTNNSDNPLEGWYSRIVKLPTYCDV
jgi:hypothetical protein